MEKPNSDMTAKVPISETGTSIMGRRVCVPILQEHQHDDEDQHEGFEQRLVNLVDRFIDEDRGVVDDLVANFGGKAAFQLGHLGPRLAGGFQGVGSRLLKDGKRDGGLAVQVAVDVVVLCPSSMPLWSSRSSETRSAR